MAIDYELRSHGIGASEVSAVVGLSPYQAPFDLYVRKLKLIDEPECTAVQRRGRYFEKGVIDWYADLTGRQTEWFDKTIVSPLRSWQLASPDAWILEDGKRVAEVQAKTVNWRNVDEYGAPNTDDVPPHCYLQSQWTMSTADTPYGELAALCGMDELRPYRIWRDAEIEAVLLEEVDKFWRLNVLAHNPPPIGNSEAAARYLKEKFPRNIEPLRVATPEEHDMLLELKQAGEEYDRALAFCTTVENRVKLAIASAGGLLDGKAKVTWHRCKDQMGPDWCAIAEEAIGRLADVAEWGTKQTAEIKAEMVKAHTKVLKQGSRRLLTNWGKMK